MQDSHGASQEEGFSMEQAMSALSLVDTNSEEGENGNDELVEVPLEASSVNWRVALKPFRYPARTSPQRRSKQDLIVLVSDGEGLAGTSPAQVMFVDASSGPPSLAVYPKVCVFVIFEASVKGRPVSVTNWKYKRVIKLSKANVVEPKRIVTSIQFEKTPTQVTGRKGTKLALQVLCYLPP